MHLLNLPCNIEPWPLGSPRPPLWKGHRWGSLSHVCGAGAVHTEPMSLPWAPVLPWAQHPNKSLGPCAETLHCVRMCVYTGVHVCACMCMHVCTGVHVCVHTGVRACARAQVGIVFGMFPHVPHVRGERRVFRTRWWSAVSARASHGTRELAGPGCEGDQIRN